MLSGAKQTYLELKLRNATVNWIYNQLLPCMGVLFRVYNIFIIDLWFQIPLSNVLSALQGIHLRLTTKKAHD